jgi:hypothetical protein
MKRWVSVRPAGSNIRFVDFDAMSLSSNAPPICANENWHYQVYTIGCRWRGICWLSATPSRLYTMTTSAVALQCFLTWPATSNKVQGTLGACLHV